MLVIDYSQLMTTTIFGELGNRKDIEIDIGVCRNLFLHTILDYKKKYSGRFGPVVLAIDGKDYWRRKEFKYYKFTRKQAKLDSGFDWEQIKYCLNTVKDELREYFHYPVVEVSTAEADDIVAVLAEWSQTNDLDGDGFFDVPKDFLIVSADEDFCQLQCYKNVRQISPITRKQVKADIPLDQFCLDHVLRGDSSDSVQNILTGDNFFFDKQNNPDVKYRQKSVSKKIFEFYYEQWKESGIITNWLEPEHEKNFERNKKLVLFTEIPQYVKDSIVEEFQNQQGKDRSKIMDYLIQHKLKNLFSELHEF